MSGKASSPAPRPRNSEGKLYQACLDACIDGIGRLQVGKRRGSSGAHKLPSFVPTTRLPVTNNGALTATLDPIHNTSGQRPLNSIPPRPATPLTKSEPATSLPSPPQSPVSATSMNRSALHGAPPRGAPLPTWGSQDARSNLAVEPAANPGNFKLKKNAVKVVGAASPVSRASTRPAAPAPAIASSPVPGPVQSKLKEADGHAPASPATPATPILAPRNVPSRVGIFTPSDVAESALDSLFSRLTTQSPDPPSRTTEAISFAGPDKAIFSFDHRPNTADAPKQVLESTTNPPLPPVKPEQAGTAIATALPEKAEPTKETDSQKVKNDTKHEQNMSREGFEHEYLLKASQYVSALPATQNMTVQTIKAVSKKLRSSYVPDAKLDTKTNEALKARYVFAVLKYVNQLKRGPKLLTADFIREILKNNDGNFLAMCAVLVSEEHIALENLDDVAGLCKTILDSLPTSEPVAATMTTTMNPAEALPTTNEARQVSNDPMDNTSAWASQEKRDNAANYRTCVLKGVSGVTSINQLQALVWGGRLESISMPETGSDFALVKFLTPEACQKYFEATENGIEVAGDKKMVIFVERTAGPNSSNDVINNCIKGDASRCVRAVGADEDWSDVILMKLARGKSQMKREVDRTKRGKTARGHNFIEFRFANIYHALGFKRELMDDMEWEHCTIGYAPDPCETAHGVHLLDEDEEGSGSST
ncbi:Nn.00g041510.m01.CDS01 [Neocucurbitaria sp. VM-36]